MSEREGNQHHITGGVRLSEGLGIGPARCESTEPKEYRLAVTQSGEYVLQGAFYWSEGLSGGVEWRNLPTVLALTTKA